MQVVQCGACAGSVIYDAGAEVASCLFCGSVAVEPSDLREEIPEPDGTLEFAVDRAAADAAYRRWALSSWWHPKEIRKLGVNLRAVLLPAWRFEAEIETHWAGLTRAVTRSGYRPVSGVANKRESVLVPASMGLTDAELTALAPFHSERAAVGQTGGHALPTELASITAQAARQRAHAIAEKAHRNALRQEHRLRRCHGSTLLRIESSHLLLLPIWIGSFRYRDLPYRFVINAQSGTVTGRAPIDRIKIVAVVLLGVALALALAILRWE